MEDLHTVRYWEAEVKPFLSVSNKKDLSALNAALSTGIGCATTVITALAAMATRLKKHKEKVVRGSKATVSKESAVAAREELEVQRA